MPAEQGILIAGKDGHILSADETTCRLLSYRAEDLLGQSLWALIGLDPRQGGKEVLSPVYREVRFPCGAGEMRTVQVSLSRLLLDSQQVFVCSLRQREEGSDGRVAFLAQVVSTLQQAKDEMQLSLDREKAVGQLKTRFIALASHEFRTPLSSIQLSAALIERYFDKQDREQVFRHLNKIRLRVDDLTGILEDLLCLERMNGGSIVPHYEVIDLPLFCRELAVEMQVLVKPGQQIRYQHHSDQLEVKLDKKLLRNCLMNLLSNAIKYSSENAGIDLETEVAESGCDIRITDQGIGIPAADQGNLFEPFFRAQNVTALQGTGLGLNIVKRYAELMQGSISFESQVQQGSVFTLNFPVR